MKQWKDIPKNVGYQKDFYRIEAPGVEPNTMEQILEEYESQAASVVKKVIEIGAFPTGDDFTMLIVMVALMAFRTPHFRRMYEKPLEDIGNLTLKMMSASPELWNQIQEGMKRNGYAVKKKTSYEEMKHFVDSNNYTLEIRNEFSRGWHIQILLKLVEEIMPSLMSRKWSLSFAKNKSDEFICSDSPVSLICTKPISRFDRPGFERENTEVIVPLNKNVVLLGRFEGESHILWASRKQVAAINSLSIIYAQRFIYSPRKNFYWLNKDGGIGNADDILDELKKEKMKRSKT